MKLKIILFLFLLSYGIIGTSHAQLLKPDENFETGSGFNNIVWSLAQHTDSNITVGGAFTSYKGQNTGRFVRLNTDGSLNAAFNNNLGTGFNNTVFNQAIQTDGKIVIVGKFTTFNGVTRNRIVRLNSNGTADNTFNIGTGFNAETNQLAIQADERIVVVGKFTTFNGITTSGIARLNSTGTIDNNLNVGTGFNVNEGGTGSKPVRCVAIQSDGKIIVAGDFTKYNGVTVNRLVRLNSNGTLDATFSSKIKFNNTVYDIKIQPDGKIVAIGAFSSCDGIHASYKIARINSNGNLDQTFNANIQSGFYTPADIDGSMFNPRTISLQANGRIIIGGGFKTFNGTSVNHLLRLNADGSYEGLSNDNRQWLAPLRLASFNLRYKTSLDEPLNAWADRKYKIEQIVKKYDLDIIGAQEPYIGQINDLLILLPEYDYLGLSRNGDMATNQNFTPIFYKKARFEVMNHGQFWLSETPNIPGSIGWDAQSARICTWALFKEKATGKQFYFYNTHFDHIGSTARLESAQLMINYISPRVTAGYPVILTGDFNSNNNTVPYINMATSGVLKDSYDLALSKINNERGTHNGFDINYTATSHIDHIFITTSDKYRVLSWQNIIETVDGKFASDHNPLMIELNLLDE